MAIKKKTRKKVRPLKAVERRSHLPATHGQLETVRSELKSQIVSLELKMDSKFEAIDAKFTALDSRFEAMMAKINSMHVIWEDQNAKNNYVMDGLRAVIDAQNALSERVSKIEKVTFGTEN